MKIFVVLTYLKCACFLNNIFFIYRSKYMKHIYIKNEQKLNTNKYIKVVLLY